MNNAILSVSRVHYPVTALGFGERLGIWVQGCPLACPGCVAQDTWPADAGIPVPVSELVAASVSLMAQGADGVTISGGEPLEQAGPLGEFLGGVDDARRGRAFDMMVYTGYELDELNDSQRKTAALADVLVTGRYRVAEPTELIWRGSANQILRLQTPLAEERYASYVDCVPEHPPIQLEPAPDGFWFAGVPRAGTLPAIEAALREQGFPIETATWRRVRPAAT